MQTIYHDSIESSDLSHVPGDALFFWLVGNNITALLTDIDSVRVVAAVLVFMAVRGLAQAIWYPRLERKLS